MINLENVEAVREREREREPQFSKINKTEDKGTEFVFICDRLKGRNKAIANLDFYVLHKNLCWQEQRASKSMFVQIA